MTTSPMSEEMQTSLGLCMAYSDLSAAEVLVQFQAGHKYVYNLATQSGYWQ